jgi:hypothetical protein
MGSVQKTAASAETCPLVLIRASTPEAEISVGLPAAVLKVTKYKNSVIM